MSGGDKRATDVALLLLVASAFLYPNGCHTPTGRPPPPITKRLPRLLPSDRSGRLTASAALRRGCGRKTKCRLNSAMCRTRPRCARRKRGRGRHAQMRSEVSKGEDRGSFPLVAPLLVLFSRHGEKSTFQGFSLPLSLRGERKGRKEAPPKEETHGFFLGYPSSLACACLPLASLSRAHSLGYGQCAVTLAVCQIAATALEQRRRGQSPRSVCR